MVLVAIPAIPAKSVAVKVALVAPIKCVVQRMENKFVLRWVAQQTVELVAMPACPANLATV